MGPTTNSVPTHTSIVVLASKTVRSHKVLAQVRRSRYRWNFTRYGVHFLVINHAIHAINADLDIAAAKTIAVYRQVLVAASIAFMGADIENDGYVKCTVACLVVISTMSLHGFLLISKSSLPKHLEIGLNADWHFSNLPTSSVILPVVKPRLVVNKVLKI